MTLAALALVLGAAVMHAVWNALAKRGRDPMAFLWWATGVGGAALVPFGVGAVVSSGVPPAAVPYLLVTAVLHAFYFYALARAYRTGAFSLVYPIARGLGVAVVPVIALFVFDERLSPIGMLGIALVIAGVVGLHLTPGAPSRTHAPGARVTAATVWAVITGLTIATYSLLDKAGVEHVSPLVYMTVLSLGCWALLWPAVARHRDRLAVEWRENWRTILVAGVMTAAGYLFVLFAFRLSKTGYVVAAREVSIVFSAVIATVWMREGGGLPRLVGAGVVLAGVACIAAGQ